MKKRSFTIITFGFLVLLIYGKVLAVPVEGEVVSVEEFDLTSDHTVPTGTEDKHYDNETPLYELQLAVWPGEVIGTTPDVAKPLADNSQVPIYEEQEVVYPDLTQPDSSSGSIWHKPQQSTTPKPVIQNDLLAAIFPVHEAAPDLDVLHDNHVWSTVTQKPVPTSQVEVIEQFQVVHPNGTTEYKLVLSNGMTNYKKIYNKLMPNGKVVTVQEGYDSVPIPGDDPYSNDYQTQFYIADEHGHNVYRLEKHTRRPKLPNYLDYQLQIQKNQFKKNTFKK